MTTLPRGFRSEPRLTASGDTYRGKFTCHDVQWTKTATATLATFTATAAEIAAAAETNLLWTDQDVQRGIKPEVVAPPARELSLAAGYPDPAIYIFDARNADDIAEKILRNEQLFLSPLVWNLRPAKFDAYWAESSGKIFIYDGRVYLPDSHHRHQAIVKAVQAWRDAPESYPAFSDEQQFKIELYFLERANEGNYFFDKNQRPKPTAKSKAYDLTTLDDLSLLAKRTIEKSNALTGNVNRVTDRLVARNPQVVTLSTLREMMKTYAPPDGVDATELEGLAAVAAQFFDLLAQVRPELGHLDSGQRRVVRDTLVVDAAVMMHGYAALMADFSDDLSKLGARKAKVVWERRLARLGANNEYRFGKWSGDFFAKKNPLWQKVGIVKPGRDNKRLTVLNTGAARGESGRVLRQFLTLASPPRDIDFLATR